MSVSRKTSLAVSATSCLTRTRVLEPLRKSGQVRSGQVRSGNLILPGEPLAIGYFVAPSKEKKMYKIN